MQHLIFEGYIGVPEKNISVLYLNILHELLDISVSVWRYIAVRLHVEHRSQALPPQPVLLLQGHDHRLKQVIQRRQPLQGQRIVWLPAKCGSVVEQPDSRSMGEDVVIHGWLFMEQCPGLVAETRERRLICTKVCSIKDDGCCPFVQLDLEDQTQDYWQNNFRRWLLLMWACIFSLSKPRVSVEGCMRIHISGTLRLLVTRQEDVAQSMRSVSPGKCGNSPPLHQRRMGSSLLLRRSLLPGPLYELMEANSISDRALWGWKAPRSTASKASMWSWSSGKEAKETQTQHRTPNSPRHTHGTSLPLPAICKVEKKKTTHFRDLQLLW